MLESTDAARPDTLYRDVRLDYRVQLPVLGIPVEYRTNAPEIIEAVNDAFGVWRALEPRGEQSASLVQVRLVLHAGSEGSAEHPTVSHRLPDPERLLVQTLGSIGCADGSRRDAVAYVTPQLVADRAHFRYSVVELLTLFLVTQQDRLPLHAAGLVRGDAVLLLAGPTGVGKSTLGYAAVRAGHRLFSEDVVYVQREPTLRIWGLGIHVHLPVEAARWFPELERETPSLLMNGKRKLAVAVEEAGTPLVVERAALCLLARGPGPVRFGRERSDELARAVAEWLEPGFDRFAEPLERAMRRLTAQGGWRLTLSDDPADALPYLEEMLTALDDGA